MKKFACLVLVIMIMFSFAGCSDFAKPGTLTDEQLNNLTATVSFNYTKDAIERKVVIVYNLHYNDAPNTVANFIKLADSKFYDNKTFDTFNGMSADTTTGFRYLLGGRYSLNADKKYTLDESIKYAIKGEFTANRWYDKNEKPYNKVENQIGALAMYRTSGNDKNMDTASSAFFLSLSNSNTPNGNYAFFATVKSVKATKGSGDKAITTTSEQLPQWLLDDINNFSTKTVTTAEDKTLTVIDPQVTIESITTSVPSGVKIPQPKTIKK